MRNEELWHPTKFVFRKNKLRASRNKKDVSVSSRLIADLVAEQYQIAIPAHLTGRIVDLGCGEVPLYHLVHMYATEITCVDWPGTYHKTTYADYLIDLNTNLPFDNEMYDTVLLSDVLEHIRQPHNLISEISRILKTNGKLIMNVPFFYNLHETPYDYYRYTEFGLRFLVESNGLEVIILNPIGGFPDVISDLLGKFSNSIPFLGKWLVRLIHLHANCCRRIWLWKILREKTKRRYPLGYFLIAEKKLTQ
jgi:SAM-dependent methyltransferase